MELNHKIYEIYAEGNKSVEIKNPKEVQILRNGEANGATLHDVFRKIDDLDTNKIYGWSILQFYKAENGFLLDNEGNKISLLDGDTQIFFRRVKDPLIILNEKDVNLDYVRDVSALLGLNTIEETITALEDNDKQILIEERMIANERRQKQIAKEKAEADAKEKARLEEERKQIEQKQKEEQERLAKIEEERIAKEKEEKEKENTFSPKEFRNIKKHYVENGFSEYTTSDGKYIFLFGEEGDIPEDEEPFLIAKREGYYEELEGELTDNKEKIAEFEFKDGEDKVIILDKETGTIKVEVIT